MISPELVMMYLVCMCMHVIEQLQFTTAAIHNIRKYICCL